MKIVLNKSFLLLIYLLLIRIKSEDIEEKDKDKDKEKENFIKFDFDVPESKNSQMIVLNNNNFDSIIQNGNNNRWLIFFSAKKCGYCKRVKAVVDKIIEEKKYESVNNIKFAYVDLDDNLKLQIRFKIKGIPYIILVENNKMLELNFMPSEELYIQFIEIKNLNEEERVKDFIQELTLYGFLKTLFNMTLNDGARRVNNFLKKHKINYEFGPISLYVYTISFLSIILLLIFYVINKCCFGAKKILNKKEIENNKDRDSKDNKNENDKDINNNINEEEKKKKKEEEKVKEKEKEKKKEKSVKKKDEIKKKEKKKKKE